jgi:DNA-binding NarL/FixJ family response regulator
MKILLADRHPEVRSALRLILERIPAVTTLAEANSLAEALAQCAADAPDLVLFDLDLAAPSRARQQPLADLVHIFQRLCPSARLVAMSSRFEAKREVLEAGADGFISKTDPPDIVLDGILRFLENPSDQKN